MLLAIRDLSSSLKHIEKNDKKKKKSTDEFKITCEPTVKTNGYKS